MASTEDVGWVVEFVGAVIFEVVIVCDIPVATQATEFDLPGDS